MLFEVYRLALFADIKLVMGSVTAWRDSSGNPISCSQKLAILNENYEELVSSYQAAIDDAILMGADIENFLDLILQEYKKINRKSQG